MENKNYILLVVTVVITSVLLVLELLSFYGNLMDFIELERNGEYTTGIIKSVVDKPNKREIYYKVDTYKDSLMILPEFSVESYEVGKKVVIIYSKKNPQIARVFTYREYKFGLFLDGILTLLLLTALVIAIFKRKWILDQPGGMWPT